jgi:hypothetical protein
MDVLGGQAVELGLVSQTMYDKFKVEKQARDRRAVEESDLRLFQQLKERFEPKAKKEK